MRGLTRVIDSMGRISIPSDFRRLSKLEPGAVVEVEMDDDYTLHIKVHDAACMVCGSLVTPSNLGKLMENKKICKACYNDIKEG